MDNNILIMENNILQKSRKEPSLYSPLSLAYLGDAVYELYVRNRVLCEHEDMHANKLHQKSVKYVRAHAQSNSIMAIEERLTEEELAIFKRGRNAKSYTSPKNADIRDYRRATGFEALIGYVFLTGNRERLNELMALAFENAVDQS